ncbi:MAG TPA: hypothetical protein VNM24_03925 [Burkholderiales bacterium]|jgi:hypothetical protein|nr:hypothetical protein [Burkholderiales bacterium]
MKAAHAILRVLVFAVAAGSLGCAELKVGAGPFKAMSVEVGPGGVEAKGPSAGPFKTKGAEMDRGESEKD